MTQTLSVAVTESKTAPEIVAFAGGSFQAAVGTIISATELDTLIVISGDVPEFIAASRAFAIIL